MPQGQETDGALITKYEAGFGVFMAVLTYLWRDNSDLIYPQILYLLVVFMAVNLGAGLALRRWSGRNWLSAAFILANCATITAILVYSGGQTSNLWVLYLLPIYTVCLLLGAREVLWITAAAVAFNITIMRFDTPLWDTVSIFTLTFKSGIFVFTAMMTWRIVDRDRSTRVKLQAERLEIKKLENMMQIKNVRLDEAEKLAEVGLMSSGVAHDLNNTFTVIVGFADLARQDASLTPETRGDIEAILKSAGLGKNIVATLTGLAKKGKLAMAPCDIQEVLRSILLVLRNTLDANKVEVRMRMGKDLPAVHASRTHLQRLFLNLISNAIKAIGSRGVLTIRSEFSDRQGRRMPQVQVYIEDNGPGIPKEILTSIFKPFSTTRAAQGGTGLGLYICSEIARQHGGRLHAENRAEGGARFILHLPAPIEAPVFTGVPNESLRLLHWANSTARALETSEAEVRLSRKG